MRSFGRTTPIVLLLAGGAFAAQESTDPLMLVQQGRRLNAAGRQREALELYERALKINPDQFEAHLASGIALDLLARYEEARSHLSRAIQLAPEDAKRPALMAMAVSWVFQKRTADAAKAYEQVFDATSRPDITQTRPRRQTRWGASISRPATPQAPGAGTRRATSRPAASPPSRGHSSPCGSSGGCTRKHASPRAEASPPTRSCARFTRSSRRRRRLPAKRVPSRISKGMWPCTAGIQRPRSPRWPQPIRRSVHPPADRSRAGAAEAAHRRAADLATRPDAERPFAAERTRPRPAARAALGSRTQ